MGATERRRRSLHWGGRKKVGQKTGSIGAEEEAKVGKSLVEGPEEGMDTFSTGIALNATSCDFTFSLETFV